MRFCSLKFQNLVRKIDLVNRRWVFYSRAYGIYLIKVGERDKDFDICHDGLTSWKNGA